MLTHGSNKSRGEATSRSKRKTTMKVRLIANGTLRLGEIVYFDEKDEQFLGEWKAAMGYDRHPRRRDALEFAENACKRRKAYRDRDDYATCLDDIKDYVKEKPQAEVANLVVLTCDWYPPSRVAGICHFRRTWCNNLIIDYLAACPPIVVPRIGDMVVKGVGTCLMYYVAKAAIELECNVIWGEATQNSYEFYQSILDLKPAQQDLILAPKPAFCAAFRKLAAKPVEEAENEP